MYIIKHGNHHLKKKIMRDFIETKKKKKKKKT